MADISAISIRQPWAYMVCTGLKDVENKDQKINYRGPLVIHAGSNQSNLKSYTELAGSDVVPQELFAFGAAIGIVELVDCVEMNQELEANRSAVGEYCWIFAKPRLFKKPIPLKGKLGLFKISGAEREKVERAIATALPVKPPRRLAEFYLNPTDDDWKQMTLSRVENYLRLNRFEDLTRLCGEAIHRGFKDPLIIAGRAYGRFQIAPDDDDATFNAEMQKALRGIDNAVGWAPEDPRIRFMRAEMLVAVGETSAAREEIAVGQQLDPDLQWKELQKMAKKMDAELSKR